MVATPRLEGEREGLAIAADYSRAIRDYIEYVSWQDTSPSPTARVTKERSEFQRTVLAITVLEARESLRDWIKEHGPVEDSRGVWRLDGSGRVTFRRLGWATTLLAMLSVWGLTWGLMIGATFVVVSLVQRAFP